MIASLLFGLNQMERVYGQLHAQSTSSSEISTTVSNMNNAMLSRTLSLRKILLMDDVFDIDQERLRMYEQGLRINRGIETLSELPLSETERYAFEQFLIAAHEGNPQLQDILDRIIGGEPIIQLTPMIEAAFAKQEVVVASLLQLSEAIHASNQQTIGNTLRNHQQAALQTSIFLIAATCIAIITALYVITWSQRQLKKIEDEREKFSALFNRNMDAVALISDDVILECNAHFRELFFLEDSVLPIPVTTLFPEKRAVDFNLDDTWNEHVTLTDNRNGARFEWVFKRVDGSTFDADVSLSNIPLTGDNLIQAVIRDITAQKQYQDRIKYQATHDPLTGLYNRNVFFAKLKSALQDCTRSSMQHSLCYIDLDKFKEVNDTVGHAAGDKLLMHIVNLLNHYIRSTDILARLGGDEFGLLLPNCNREKALEITQCMREAVEKFTFTWKGQHFNVTLSIGLTTFSDGNLPPDEIINLADAACYRAKNNGRNQIYSHS